MEKMKNIIDIFVNIVDNYGDMGFTTEFIQACRHQYGDEFQYIIWTNNAVKMQKFARQADISDIEIVDIVDFGYLRKSVIGISLLHAPLPDLILFAEKAIILRIDYLSLDLLWLVHNEREYIASTIDRLIIELIPSPLGGAGLIPISRHSEVRRIQDSKILDPSQVQDDKNIHKTQRHIVIFTYKDSLNYIDFDTFPDDLIVYVFGEVISTKKNIISLDFLPSSEFYHLLDTSEFVIIRGEVTFAHMIQTGVPFFWNMYSDIGGFPTDQSEQFLLLIGASESYRELHVILNAQKSGKIEYSDLIGALSHTQFDMPRIQNLIHTVKKHIDRFNNSI